MMTITFEIASAEEGASMMHLYEILKEERKCKGGVPSEPTDFEKRMRSISLDELIGNGELDVRSANALRAEGLTDVYSIGKMFFRDSGRTMLKIPNLGKKSLKSVEVMLYEVGFLPNVLLEK